MRTCPKCGATADANFCPNCGNPMSPEGTAASAPQATPKAPPQQAPFQPQPFQPAPYGKPKKPFYKRWWFILIVILVALIVIIGVFGESDPDTSSTEPTTKTTEKSTTKATEKATEPKDDTTLGQRNAVAKAKEYISFSGFSHEGLIKQLEFEGFSKKEATYGADNCGADWNQQAEVKAQEYIDSGSFSKEGLIEQLKFEGFTDKQAAHGAKSVGY